MYRNATSSPTVTNCILWGDSPDEIFNQGVGAVPTVSFSDVQGGLGAGTIDGGGNINAYPILSMPMDWTVIPPTTFTSSRAHPVSTRATTTLFPSA